MYVVEYYHVQQAGHQPVSLWCCNLARGRPSTEINFPCPRSRLRIWSREAGSAVPSRVSPLISILWLNLALSRGLLSFLPLPAPLTAIGSLPSSSGHATEYLYVYYQVCRGTTELNGSPPRVRRHLAGSPQDSSINSIGCCLLIVSENPINIFLYATRFLHPLLHWYTVWRFK